MRPAFLYPYAYGQHSRTASGKGWVAQTLLAALGKLEVTFQVSFHEFADDPAHSGSLFGGLLLQGCMRFLRYPDHDVLVFPHYNLHV